jgi:hypothetical protein
LLRFVAPVRGLDPGSKHGLVDRLQYTLGRARHRTAPDRPLRLGQIGGFLDLTVRNRLERTVAVVRPVASPSGLGLGEIDLRDLRDRALIATLTYSFARITAALRMKVEDLRPRGAGWSIRLHEKGGKHAMPCHYALAEALRASPFVISV